MKRQSIKIIALALLLAGTAVACGEKETNENPVEIPFVEYSLQGTNCQWTNLNYDNKVIVINRNDDFKKYIDCTDESYPEIDFSKNTLLLASGGGGDIRRTEIQFLKNTDNKYTLKVMLHEGIAAVVLAWKAAILLPKMSDKVTVTLIVEQTYN
jgi:hypothetical protein